MNLPLTTAAGRWPGRLELPHPTAAMRTDYPLSLSVCSRDASGWATRVPGDLAILGTTLTLRPLAVAL
jgi:hypothetical protein